MNKNRENFIKYSNDLYFHHLLVENKKIRTLICQELVLDRKIISIKLKNAQQYGKSYYEKKLILDILAVDDVDEHYIVYPFNRMEITIIHLEYINQAINEMTSFNQLMYLFKNEKPYDKIEIDYRIKEAIQMHDKYISSDESYQEYLDRLDNEILLRSRDKKIEEANKKFEKASNEIDHLLNKTKENIIKYIKMQFHEDISNFISTLSKQQILDIQDRLFDYTSIEKLKNSVKKHQ